MHFLKNCGAVLLKCNDTRFDAMYVYTCNKMNRRSVTGMYKDTYAMLLPYRRYNLLYKDMYRFVLSHNRRYSVLHVNMRCINTCMYRC